ncbi:MAG: L-seryl-tRNA(Sec) selenium transferase [Acidobacteriota bacterium]
MSARPPRMDRLLGSPEGQALQARFGGRETKRVLREVLLEGSRGWRNGGPVPQEGEILGEAGRRLEALFRPPLRRVLNATGVVLHTNLGRAPFSPGLLREVSEVLSGYTDLELDLAGGGRGHRDAALEGLLRRLFDTDYAVLVVNNNAAATLLLLNTFSAGRETLVSRGELVEIGGGFRMPEVMAASGARLREVGTTNRTRPADFRKAAGPESGLLLKVHTSNYRIVGFTEEVSLRDLTALGRELRLPVALDLGSGLLWEGLQPLLPDEPSVAEALKEEPDALCFSGDKLLGACQAGILLVKPRWAEAFRKNPLTRAMRVDKVTYALLGAVAQRYLRDRPGEIPALALLGRPEKELRRRARALRRRLLALCPGAFDLEVAAAEGRSGAGSAPVTPLPSPALAVVPLRGSAEELERFLRTGGEPPVLAQVAEGRVLLHLRTLLPGEEALLAARLLAYAGRQG